MRTAPTDFRGEKTDGAERVPDHEPGTTRESGPHRGS
ncbi:hypothetical protein D893_02244 [Thioalkalivibrio sp. ALE21]|nr:hypothetical protein D893_02244 [Thioalkalivibrio sp. ALE21]